MEIFKYLFQRNLAIQLIYCEINFTLIGLKIALFLVHQEEQHLK